MHRSSAQARLVEVDYPCFPIDLGMAEATRSGEGTWHPEKERSQRFQATGAKDRDTC